MVNFILYIILKKISAKLRKISRLETLNILNQLSFGPCGHLRQLNSVATPIIYKRYQTFNPLPQSFLKLLLQLVFFWKLQPMKNHWILLLYWKNKIKKFKVFPALRKGKFSSSSDSSSAQNHVTLAPQPCRKNVYFFLNFWLKEETPFHQQDLSLL